MTELQQELHDNYKIACKEEMEANIAMAMNISGETFKASTEAIDKKHSAFNDLLNYYAGNPQRREDLTK